MRGADAGPWKMLCSLPAFWVGLIYDEEAQRQALELISDWTAEEREYLRVTAPRHSLQTEFRGEKLQKVAQQVVGIAKGGLQRRGRGEEGFLQRLEEIADTGKSQADLLLDLYNREWEKSVDPLFTEYMY